MRSCNERTILHCLESYLYYVILVNKQIFSEECGWAGVQRTNFCRITTCNERCINRVHLTFSLYTNCQNRLNEFVMLIYIYNKCYAIL
jgi:hypothetical protein